MPCVALAEGVAGSEEIFAQMMNREAERLGMKEIQPFPQFHRPARPRALLDGQRSGQAGGALIRDFPEEYARYYTIKSFRYNNINQPNRNRLL